MSSLFQGIPLFWQYWFSLTLLVVLHTLVWKVLLYRFSRRWQKKGLQESELPAGDKSFLWVFLVPALNEEVTISQTVHRLMDLPLRDRLVMVVDDGSDDQTPQVLNELQVEHPEGDLLILRRDHPRAQQGKAQALNQAFSLLSFLSSSRGFGSSQVLVTIVDADGYLDQDVGSRVEPLFCDPKLGGLQLQVSIYNRSRLLTRLQDWEFAIFGFLFQAGRSSWNTACMGGSGQINRMSALQSVSRGDGPWQDCLTEDQDLGLRLMTAGWAGRHLHDCYVYQQGLYHLRPLLRQRTRWAQGNLQAISLWPRLWKSRVGILGKLEMLGFLLMPFSQMIVGVSLIGALWLWVSGQSALLPLQPPWFLILFYCLGMGGVLLGCTAGAPTLGKRQYIKGFLLAHPYMIYTWILWPVLLRAFARSLLGRTGWSKTQREALEAA